MIMKNPISLIIILLSILLWVYLPWSEWMLHNQVLFHGMVDGEYQLVGTSNGDIIKSVFYVTIVISILLFISSVFWFRKLDIGKIKYIPVVSSLTYIMWCAWILSPL